MGGKMAPRPGFSVAGLGSKEDMNTTRMGRRLIALASLAAVTASASALSVDPQITIDRALNSPTLSVRYTGVAATLVELRINGESVGTREVAGGRNAGETNFTVDLESLKDGDNLVEICLFDRTGKLVAKDKTNISTFKGKKGPVFVEAPKAGASVMGPVEIKVGFGENLGNSYVSFFVDGNFKSMTNFPPFNFVWDTEKETNGWHEVEAWAIDETNVTHKTGTVRLFVNNPGGRTNRVGVPSNAVVPTRNVSRVMGLVGAEAGTRAINSTTASLATRGATPQGLPPAVVERMTPIANSVRAAVTGASTVRSVTLGNTLATGPKSLVPTGARLAKATAEISTAQTVARAHETVIAAAAMVAITRGTKLPNLGTFAVILDAQPVRFDVPPKVVDGIALAPFRSIVEKAGGKVTWEHATKTVRAGSDGHTIELKIGGASARVDGQNLVLEKASSIDRGRTVVPLSFLRDALKMDVKFDSATGNVILSTKK